MQDRDDALWSCAEQLNGQVVRFVEEQQRAGIDASHVPSVLAIYSALIPIAEELRAGKRGELDLGFAIMTVCLHAREH